MAASATDSDVTGAAYEEHLQQVTHYQNFQTWANRNYGENSKTKTVTRSKYTRIMRVVSGQEAASPENTKLRFWIKSKGFEVHPVPCNLFGFGMEYALFVPTKIHVRLVVSMFNMLCIHVRCTFACA